MSLDAARLDDAVTAWAANRRCAVKALLDSGGLDAMVLAFLYSADARDAGLVITHNGGDREAA